MKPSWFRSIWNCHPERIALWIKPPWSQSPKQDLIDWFDYHIFYDSFQAQHIWFFFFFNHCVFVSCSSMQFKSKLISFEWSTYQDQLIIESTSLNLQGWGSLYYVHCPRSKWWPIYQSLSFKFFNKWKLPNLSSYCWLTQKVNKSNQLMTWWSYRSLNALITNNKVLSTASLELTHLIQESILSNSERMIFLFIFLLGSQTSHL